MNLKEKIESLWESLPTRYEETYRLEQIYHNLADKAILENPSLGKRGTMTSEFPQEVIDASQVWYNHAREDSRIMHEIHQLLDGKILERNNGKFLVPSENEYSGEFVLEMEKLNDEK